MRVIIPSYRRCGRITALEALGTCRKQVTLVVRAEEYHVYQETYRDVNVVAMPESVDSLAKTRQYIWDTYGRTRFVMMDDDIRCFQRRGSEGSYHDILPSEVEDMMRDLSSALDDKRVAMVGPRPRWNPPRRGDVTSACDATQVVAIDGAKIDGAVRWDRLPFCADRDAYLQVLDMGLDVCHDQRWSYDAPASGDGEGGLNAQQTGNLNWGDRMRKAREGMEALSKMWPGYVQEDERSPTGFNVYRSRLLRDARRRREPDVFEECPGCGLKGGLCGACKRTLEAACDDHRILRRLARYILRRDGKSVRKPSEGSTKGRGRPPLGQNHPLLVKFRGKGQFRTEDVADFYKTKSSAQVSLHNMVGKGLLVRVRPGVFQVMEPTALTPEEMAEAKARSVPGPDTPNMNKLLGIPPGKVLCSYCGGLCPWPKPGGNENEGHRNDCDRHLHGKIPGSPEHLRAWLDREARMDRMECYCMSQAMQAKQTACDYCLEREKRYKETHGL